MSDSEDDVRHWGLSDAEAALYYARVSRYWVGRARASADRAERNLRRAQRAATVIPFALAAVVALLLWKVLG